MLKRNLSNSEGFTLIEVMVSVGILGSLALAYLHFSERIIDSERRMLETIEMNEIITRVRYQLNDSLACTKTLSVEKHLNGLRVPTKLENILDRNGRPILSVSKREGKFKVESIQLILETSPLSSFEEPRFLNLIIRLIGKGQKPKATQFKLTVPVLLGVFEDNTPRFLYCDSLTNGVASDLTNVLMQRTCSSFKVSYNPSTGLCDFESSLGVFQPNEETMKMIQRMLTPKDTE